jgi:hypothetical protein
VDASRLGGLCTGCRIASTTTVEALLETDIRANVWTVCVVERQSSLSSLRLIRQAAQTDDPAAAGWRLFLLSDLSLAGAIGLVPEELRPRFAFIELSSLLS